MRNTRLKKRLAEGETLCGPNVHLDSPWLIEIIGEAGFDFVMLDGEHGLVGNCLPHLLLAADAVDTPAIVRVPSHERGYLTNALEIGAGGILVPMVHTPDQAKPIAQEVRFPPLGLRGFSNVSRAGRYGGIPAKDFGRCSNDEILLILMLERVEAFENAEAIASVPGVDMVFIGPSDLAQSLGYPGQPEHPKVDDAIRSLIQCLAPIAKIGIASTSPECPESVTRWRKDGAQCFLVSSIHPIRNAFHTLSARLRESLDEPAES